MTVETQDLQIVSRIYQSKDYGIFKQLNGNRIVDRLHVTRLKESFQEKYLISPILVNENYQIIDGQHRFEAAKELNYPVYFFFVDGYRLPEVQILNTHSKNWHKIDYLNAYCDLGNETYLTFRRFMNAYPEFGISAIEAILTNKTASNAASTKQYTDGSGERKNYNVKNFQEGRLKIHDYDISVRNANRLREIKKYYDGYNRSVFVRAMLSIFRLEHYSHARFLDRLRHNQAALYHCSTIKQYKYIIEEIYNFRSQTKVSLRY